MKHGGSLPTSPNCRNSGKAVQRRDGWQLFVTFMRLKLMPSPEEYRRRAAEARKQANVCRNQWERQGLLMIAQQCERLAAYKELSRPSASAATAAQDNRNSAN
jgi:hypothetical protein